MIIRPATPADLDEIRAMLREYAAWLEVDLCFQNFEQELAGLPDDYAPPSGRLLIAETAGCVALRAIDDEVCEMKRLYLRADRASAAAWCKQLSTKRVLSDMGA
jgi:putative acetyltransferase